MLPLPIQKPDRRSMAKKRKASRSDWYLCRWLFYVMPYENAVSIPVGCCALSFSLVVPVFIIPLLLSVFCCTYPPYNFSSYNHFISVCIDNRVPVFLWIHIKLPYQYATFHYICKARKNFDFSQLTGFFPEIRTWINFIGLKFHILQNTILPNKQTALMQSASPE